MPDDRFAANMQKRVICSVKAAQKYEIPANILLAIAEKDVGKTGQWIVYRLHKNQHIHDIKKIY